MRVFGVGFPELAITSIVLIVPLIISVLLIVVLVLGIKALLKYLRSTDWCQPHLTARKKADAF